MIQSVSADELLFFDSKQQALPLYMAFREAVLGRVPNARLEVKKTQISFFNQHMFAAVSFTPVRRAKNRPNPFFDGHFRTAIQKGIFPHRYSH